MADEPDLEALRDAVLELHRRLLAAERLEVEQNRGAPMSNTEFFQAVVGNLRHAWLRPLSALVAELDEELAVAAKEGEPLSPETERRLRDELRALVAPPDPESGFGRRYLQLLQRDPDVVLAHAALGRRLGT